MEHAWFGANDAADSSQRGTLHLVYITHGLDEENKILGFLDENEHIQHYILQLEKDSLHGSYWRGYVCLRRSYPSTWICRRMREMKLTAYARRYTVPGNPKQKMPTTLQEKTRQEGKLLFCIRKKNRMEIPEVLDDNSTPWNSQAFRNAPVCTSNETGCTPSAEDPDDSMCWEIPEVLDDDNTPWKASRNSPVCTSDETACSPSAQDPDNSICLHFKKRKIVQMHGYTGCTNTDVPWYEVDTREGPEDNAVEDLPGPPIDVNIFFTPDSPDGW